MDNTIRETGIYKGGRWGTVKAAPVDEMHDEDRTDYKYEYSPDHTIYKGGRWGTVNRGPVKHKKS